MSKQFINPEELYNSRQFGFSQAVVSDPGKLVFISGQLSCDKDLHLLGGADLVSQSKQAFENLKTAIEKTGGTMNDIVSLRLYMVDYREEDADSIGNVLREYFGTDHPPATSWIGVKSLVNNKFLIEVEAQAVINQNPNQGK